MHALLQGSGRTQWERPLEYFTPRFDGQVVVHSGNNGWAKYWDDTHGAHFYYNEITGETTWERPVSFSTPRSIDGGLPIGWSQAWDAANHTHYYIHDATGSTQYEPPIAG